MEKFVLSNLIKDFYNGGTAKYPHQYGTLVINVLCCKTLKFLASSNLIFQQFLKEGYLLKLNYNYY